VERQLHLPPLSQPADQAPAAPQAAGAALVGLYGAGGFGREVMPLLAECLAPGARAVFVESEPRTAEVNGWPVLSDAAFFAEPCAERLFNVAVADSRTRQRIAEACLARGARPLSLISRHALVGPHNEIGEGAILCAFAVVTANARIGRFFHGNIRSYVAHDCVIGDYVTFAPGVCCNGNVVVRDHAYLGTGAIIRNGSPGRPLVIGEGAVVGMGAVVTKDVPPFTTVVGNPARPLPRRD
jgi:sugar O-acyltransferase (sialic acid O-acetyltransferase NeuD family)